MEPFPNLEWFESALFKFSSSWGRAFERSAWFHIYVGLRCFGLRFALLCRQVLCLSRLRKRNAHRSVERGFSFQENNDCVCNSCKVDTQESLGVFVCGGERESDHESPGGLKLTFTTSIGSVENSARYWPALICLPSQAITSLIGSMSLLLEIHTVINAH